MAKPIEPTPRLEGKDAELFVESILNFKPDPRVARFIEKCVSLRKQSKY